MTWTTAAVIIFLGFVKIMMTCLPTDAVNWLISKFEMHGKLDEVHTSVSIDGIFLPDKEKHRVIAAFNTSTVLNTYYIFPGNEKLFLHPEHSGIPIVIQTKRGKKSVQIFLYRYSDRIDIVRQVGKKVIAYSAASEPLQIKEEAFGALVESMPPMQ